MFDEGMWKLHYGNKSFLCFHCVVRKTTMVTKKHALSLQISPGHGAVILCLEIVDDDMLRRDYVFKDEKLI